MRGLHIHKMARRKSLSRAMAVSRSRFPFSSNDAQVVNRLRYPPVSRANRDLGVSSLPRCSWLWREGIAGLQCWNQGR